jgi:hypothetical protein
MSVPRVLSRPSRRHAPAGLPILSAGKHRRPRRGACLMEYVSVLAGRRFSAAPACTDRTLAAVARAVNDYSSDGARQQLTRYAGELTTAGRLEVVDQQDLVRRVVLTALPFADGHRRCTLLVSLLGLERAAAGRSEGFERHMMGLDTELALLGMERDVARAGEQLALWPVEVAEHHKKALAVTVEVAVRTIAAFAPEPDAVLHDLLGSCLDDHRRARTRTLAVRTARARSEQPSSSRVNLRG